MITILLEPTDVLFFRDGRPMSGSLSGHGAAWPLPNVISHAFHGALHRAGLNGVHLHRRGRSGKYLEDRDRKFGSLVTAGPFPVCNIGAGPTWFFPRPSDADWMVEDGKLKHRIILAPTRCKNRGASSLPAPLVYSVGSTIAPSKDEQKRWWSEGAWNGYLGTTQRDDVAKRLFFKTDSEFAETEHTYGIELSPETGSVVEGQFYSASYLRLRAGWRLGAFASAPDNDFRDEKHGNDLVVTLLNGHGGQILVGGQQRICTATCEETMGHRLPLPLGKSKGFTRSKDRYLVKWILLTPAIWPEIVGDPSHKILSHMGGWLPNWIAEKKLTIEGEQVEAGSVLLLNGPGRKKAKRKNLTSGKRVAAKLVAAIVPKPIPVTGWALPNDTDRMEGGAKSTHLAVPAGAVYYFEADSPAAAEDLASALNWHGGQRSSSLRLEPGGAAGSATESPAGETLTSTIRNRRSTLMGEKGFGLGVCGTWNFLGEGDTK